MKLSISNLLYRSIRDLPEFHRRAMAAAGALSSEVEIVMVNNGSPDEMTGSWSRSTFRPRSGGLTSWT